MPGLSGLRIHKSVPTRLGACRNPRRRLGLRPFPMTNAVIRTGGKQYRVAPGDTIRIEKLAGEPGAAVEFSDVLMLGGDTVKVGKPTVDGAKVTGQIVEQGRGEKLVIFKFRRRKRYKRKNGHRQSYTAVRITDISG